MTEVNRRTLVRGAAWSVPAIAVATAAPAYAASMDPPNTIVAGPDTSKCPGQSTNDPWTYINTFTFSTPPESVTVEQLIINGVIFQVDRVVPEGLQVHVVSVASSNSADASGQGVINYTANGVAKIFTFTYSGSHPNKQLCKRI